MPKTIEQLRKTEADELTAHDIAALLILTGLCANPNAVDLPLVDTARQIADEFMRQREQKEVQS